MQIRIPASAGPTIERFHASDAFIRLIVGPTGAGAPRGCVTEILRRAARQSPGKLTGRRRSRWAVIRSSAEALKLGTTREFQRIVPAEAFPIRDGVCRIARDDLDLEVLFMSLARSDDRRKLADLELTGAWLPQTRELTRAVLDDLTAVVGLYPPAADGGPTWSGIVGDTLPPHPQHWIPELEAEAPPGVEIFHQPSGRSAAAENKAQLPDGYYERLAQGKSAPWIKVNIDAEYGSADETAPTESSDTASFAQYQTDPVGFVTNVLGEFVWSKQREILEAVRDHRRVAVKSCHDVGKSFIAARIACWYLSCWPAGEVFVVTSAPTFNQVRAILWREINRAHRKGLLPGKVNQTEWWRDGELVAFGRKPDDMDTTAFQGIHARIVVVILDEACGIPKALYTGADALVTNDDSREISIGNPDDPASEFAAVCKPGAGRHVIQISAFDSPNFTDEPVPDSIRPLLIGKTWVEEKRKSWGESSPLYVAKVLGEFPEVSNDTLISPSLIAAAQRRELAVDAPNELGVDVARMGDDKTVLVHRAGGHVRVNGRYAKQDTMATVGRVIIAIRATGATAVKIDDAGLGGGVTDRLNELKRLGDETLRGVTIVPVNVGRASSDPKQFLNLRAELCWALREEFVTGTIDLDPLDDDLAAQCGKIRYEVTSKGQIQIEAKVDMKARGEASPDDFDALVLAVARPWSMDVPIVAPIIHTVQRVYIG